MAQWKETLEPYVKVYERIKTAALNPVAGQDLVVGAVIISDAGPSIPTLITSQSEFLSMYASQDLTKDYVESINKLYKGDDKSLASTVWLNAYRLAGSANMLVVRASKSKDSFFAKPLVKGDNNVYILKDGQLLKKVQSFKIVIDIDKDSSEHTTDGWSINLNGVGIIGNRNTDEGAQYDYYVQNLEELVDYLNDTSKFFSPAFKFYDDEKGQVESSNPNNAKSVVFEEVYLGKDFLDVTDPRCKNGLAYVVTCEPDWTMDQPTQKVVDLNGIAFSNFEDVPFYATNNFNSSTELKVRIRRFNHDAVVTKELSKNDVYAGGDSPYTVLPTVLDTFTNGGLKEPSEDVLFRDFYEVAVLDPSLDKEPLYFNVGNILGRGDIDEATLNESLKMIQVQLPDNLKDLGLEYYGYVPANKKSGWAMISKKEAGDGAARAKNYKTKAELEAVESPSPETIATVGKEEAVFYKYTSGQWKLSPESKSGPVNFEEATLEVLKDHVKKPSEGNIAKIGKDVEGTFYKYKKVLGAEDIEPEEIFVDLSIDPSKYELLNVSDNDMMKALDLISQDEVYVTEGVSDLGNTSPMFQSYLANMAISDNYFYPISTVNSTNYLSIANGINRISQDSSKLYASAPWDIDTGTVGFKFYASPSVLFWESVCRNKALDREFASIFGFGATGVAQYQKPVVEFNKRQRQLLLSKKVNTVLWNTQGQTWNMNDSYTKQSENNILSEDGNSRLTIRISKAMPVLTRQFIGKKITDTLYADMKNVIDYWFKSTIMPMQYTVDDYKVTIADLEMNDDNARRANKVYVLVEVRYQRSLKFIEVYNDALDMGMEFNGQI